MGEGQEAINEMYCNSAAEEYIGMANEPVTIVGVVDKIYMNTVKTPYGVKEIQRFQIGGNYYSGGFKTWPVNEGDEVELSYATNAKGYNDVKGLSVTTPNPNPVAPTGAAGNQAASGKGSARHVGRTFPVDALAPERTINRQNALTNSVAFHGAFTTNATQFVVVAEDIINTARIFEAYTTGDIDRAEAEAMIAAGKI